MTSRHSGGSAAADPARGARSEPVPEAHAESGGGASADPGAVPPLEQLFPALDVARLIASHPDGAEQLEASGPVWLSRMTYTGDLGYEIWVAPENQRYLFDLIWEAGQEFDMRLFGFRALITMRLEKNLKFHRASARRTWDNRKQQYGEG